MSNNSPQAGARSDKGPARSANEDAFWVSDARFPLQLGALYLVADGVGGQEHGATAAQKAVQVISTAFYHLRRSGSAIPEALNDAIHQANQAIYEQAQALNVSRMGCTLVAAVQHESTLYIAHVGDARAYLLMENRLRKLTRDDTWVQKQVDAGIITYEEAEKHELRNIVTQVLGNKLDITVHQSTHRDLRAGDIFLLCSDGLHGVLGDADMYLLLKNNPPQEAADALVQAAIDAQTKDNVTAVVVNMGLQKVRRGKVPPPPPKPEPEDEQPAGRQRPPAWVIATIATIALIVIGFLLYSLWSSGDEPTPTAPASLEQTGVEPLVVSPDTAVPPTLEPTQPPPTEALAIPTAIVPTAALPTATPLPAPTLPPPPTETPAPQLGCVVYDGQLFVWQDNQVFSNTCDHVAQAGQVLFNGDIVEIIDNNLIQANGPDQSCDPHQFINVRSVEQPALAGWVIAFGIQPIQPGDVCPP